MVKFENTPFFQVSTNKNLQSAKVAPGMKYVVLITFSPAEFRDYKDMISFSTEEDTFLVKIYGTTLKDNVQI